MHKDYGPSAPHLYPTFSKWQKRLPRSIQKAVRQCQERPIPTQKIEAELIAARDALRESDARFNTLADALPHMVWSTLPDGYHDYFNARWYEFTGVPHGSTDGEGWNGIFHPDDQEHAWAVWRHSLETGEPYEIEYRLRHRSGRYMWTLGRALPLRNDEGKIIRWIGTCTDIDESKRQREQVEILSRELSHRIKNIFAVITGLIGLSARRHPESKAYARELQGRIAALGRAHEFVRPSGERSHTSATPESLQGLLSQILAAYPALDEGRITIEGDDVPIDDRGATPIGLLVHELATNACKYGALSNTDGRIRIRTELVSGSLRLEWEESDGPLISGAPAETGFGTLLSDLSIQDQLGGTIERTWGAEGLRVVVKARRETLCRPRRESAEQA